MKKENTCKMWPCNIITEIRRRGKSFSSLHTHHITSDVDGCARVCVRLYSTAWNLRISVKWWGKTFWKPHLKVTNLFTYWFIYFMRRPYLVWNVMKKIPFFNCWTMAMVLFAHPFLLSLCLFPFAAAWLVSSAYRAVTTSTKKAFKVIESHSTTHSEV